MSIDAVTYAAAVSYVDRTLSGTGAIKGEDGEDGASAYEIARENGFVGTEEEWLETLKGEDGEDGTDGQNGANGVSPTATVSKTGKVSTLTVTDVNGTTTVEIMDGEDGSDAVVDGMVSEDELTAILADYAKTTDIPSIDGLATEDAMNTALDDKVDKVDGKTLSTNDLTDELKANYDDAVDKAHTHTDPLAGKHIVCIGDSLMAGNGWTGGYANCIQENHPDVTITNLAVSGARFINGEIFGQITTYYVDGGVAPDIIIFDGGGNDFINRETLGTANLASSFTNSVNTTTCDAVEELINNTLTVYPNSKLLWISTPPMHQWDDGSTIPGVPTPTVQRQYLDEIEKVLMKWGIPMADLYREGNVSSLNASQLGTFFLDGNDTVHLNEAGYRRVAPVIEAALKKLF